MYNEICRLVLLAYHGPTNDLVNVVGRDAFLEALGDPSLHVRILAEVPSSMTEALQIVLREAQTRALAEWQKPVVEEPRKKRRNLPSC